MLSNPAPTQFDLRFQLFGIPVRVHPLFWLLSVLMGWNPEHPNLIVIWVACVFVSILIHEFGHALTAQAFGWPPEVVLYSMGGLAIFQPTWRRTRTKMVLILLAGPGAGFVLYGLIRGAQLVAELRGWRIEEAPYNVRWAILQLEYVNLWWGLVNLLPVFPLDGGQITRELLSWYFPRRGLEYSLKLSIVIGAVVAVGFLMTGNTFPAMLFAMLVFENVQILQQTRYY